MKRSAAAYRGESGETATKTRHPAKHHGNETQPRSGEMSGEEARRKRKPAINEAAGYGEAKRRKRETSAHRMAWRQAWRGSSMPWQSGIGGNGGADNENI